MTPAASRARVFVLGLDGAAPGLAFERFRDELPVLAGLRAQGTWGPLHSVHPPITIPAWTCFTTGRDPGQLGLYGFHSRPDRSYAAPRLNDATALRCPEIWDLLGEAGLDSIVVGHPQGYPVRSIRGHRVAGMLAPRGARRTTWPESLAAEISEWVGEYRFDAEAHRSGDRERLRAQVWEMTRRRFQVVRRLARTRPWSFFFAHEIGLDRLQHAFWDELEGDGRTLLDYYRLLDAEIGELLESLPPETAFWIASDHGARPLEGSFCINEWLLAEGYLALRTAPPRGVALPLERLDVDWPRTRAWSDGGYCGRVYLNVAAREPEGALAAADAARTRDEIRAKLEALRGPDGRPLGTAVFLPAEVYVRSEGVPPDLLVYPGDLRLRCAGTVGHGRLFLSADDRGVDAANHAWQGLFVRRDPERLARGRVEGAMLLDVAPTLLERLGLPVPGPMRGGRIQ
jgi:predicted AlkP superfamily phosphohydrolase/phosphomutase